MLTRAQIDAARTKEVAEHNQKMMAFDAFMKLVDPATGSVPLGILEALGWKGSTGNAVSIQPLSDRPLRPIETAILDIFSSLEGEFTSASIRDQLELRGFPLAANRDAAMNAITAALSELLGREKILRTYQGVGRDPHRYAAIPGGLE